MSIELLKVVSQILELHFFVLPHFSQNYDPHVPRFDITQVICIYYHKYSTLLVCEYPFETEIVIQYEKYL